MATGYGQSGYGFVPQHHHPTPRPWPYSSWYNSPRGHVPAPAFQPPQPQQPSQAPYQHHFQQQAALQQQAAALQQQEALQYQQYPQDQQPFPVPGGCTPMPYVHESPQGYEQGHLPMSSYPNHPEQYRRPTVTFEYTPKEPVEGTYTDYPRSPRHQFTSPRNRTRDEASSRATSNNHARRRSSPSRRLMQEPGPATDEDAEQYYNPPGYDMELSNATEIQLKLLGFVFDVNSLGRWIYDAVVSKHGARTPIAEMASNHWLLLIQLAANIKRSKESLEGLRTPEDKDVVEDFIISGHRQMSKLQKLLSACERSMLNLLGEGSTLEGGSGVEFVETLYNRDVMLEDMERFVAGLEVWIHRWNDNCEPILPKRRK